MCLFPHLTFLRGHQPHWIGAPQVTSSSLGTPEFQIRPRSGALGLGTSAQEFGGGLGVGRTRSGLSGRGTLEARPWCPAASPLQSLHLRGFSSFPGTVRGKRGSESQDPPPASTSWPAACPWNQSSCLDWTEDEAQLPFTELHGALLPPEPVCHQPAGGLGRAGWAHLDAPWVPRGQRPCSSRPHPSFPAAPPGREG